MKNNLDPDWKDAIISIPVLCGGDLDLPLKVTVFDHESNGSHKPMGEFEVGSGRKRLYFSHNEKQ
jgi:hypothetical protein